MFTIIDIIIQNASGIPYIARCYSAKECIKNPNHSLVSGFFAALNSFKTEISQNELKYIGFDSTTFYIESKDDILVIIAIETEKIPEIDIRTIGCTIRDEFLSRYGDKYQNKKFVTQNFDDFISWMDRFLKRDNSNDLKPLIKKSQSKGFLSRILSIF